MKEQIEKLRYSTKALLDQTTECRMYSDFPFEYCWHCSSIRILEIIEETEENEKKVEQSNIRT